MKITIKHDLVLAGCLLAAAVGSSASGRMEAAKQPTTPYARAVADQSRPAEDLARDANRKPAETLAFIGLRPGDRIADYASGSGYFTRLFAAVVGPRGHIYASVPSELFTYANIVKGIAETKAWAAKRENVSVTAATALQAARYPEALDVFWIGQNYHDLLDPFMGPVDIAAFNRAVYTSLKPGGVYVVLDRVAAPGSPPTSQTPSTGSDRR